MTLSAISVGGFFSGCMGCMAVVEKLAKEQPGCMNLLTFSHFLFSALEGLIFTSRCFTTKQQLPLRGLLPIVLTYFLSNVVNNQTLNFHISVPLYIIFRSSTLLGNLLLCRLIEGRTYPLRKYAAVLSVTIGIILCTLTTSENLGANEEHRKELTIGVILLILGLLLSAYLPILQERLYRSYGKHPEEAMFKTNLLSLPFFAFMWNDIAKNAESFSSSAPLEVLGLQMGIPRLWAILLASVILQYICARFIYRMTSEVDSLTATLFTTLRKFFSLSISIVYFQNPFTLAHWIGTSFVFAGTLAFADIWHAKSNKKTN